MSKTSFKSRETVYQSPSCEIIDIRTEGILCQSGDSSDEGNVFGNEDFNEPGNLGGTWI